MRNICYKLGFKAFAFNALVYSGLQSLVDVVKAFTEALKTAAHMRSINFIFKIACGNFFAAAAQSVKHNRYVYNARKQQ